jgi:hypothetical protein
MPRLFPAIFTLFLVTASSFGQQPPADCPKLEIIGPSGITNPGERMTFVLQFASAEISPKEIRWEVDVGKIVSGQGTRSIDVVSEVEASTVTATATVSGVPDGCGNTASEKGGVASLPIGEPVDEFGKMSANDQRGRLDVFFAAMANSPSSLGFISLYDANHETMKRRMRFVLAHARFRKFDKKMLVFGLSAGFEQHTVLWLVPPGADFPCKDCKVVYGRDM